MGVRHLNQFIRNNCSNKAVKHIHLKKLSNKTVAVDTSIYLYKFSADSALMENMYTLISIFLEYKITPVFVFDGKPPPEKKELLRKRYLDKKEAERKYVELQNETNIHNIEEVSQDRRLEILLEMDTLKKQFIRVREEDVRKVKELMDAFGVTHIEADGEADVLCGYLTKMGIVGGCVSDDMDMFLYGCPYVIRNINILKHTAVLYKTHCILTELNLSDKEFREIMVLSGTDYNINSQTDLDETIKWHNEYSIKNSPLDFYDWLAENTTYIKDKSLLLKNNQMFQLLDYDLKKWDEVVISNKSKNKPAIYNIMKKEGFIFV